jgi:glycosyltransferase involved in cell wall biosynthesis
MNDFSMQESTQLSVQGKHFLTRQYLESIAPILSSSKPSVPDPDIGMVQAQAPLVSVIIPAYNAEHLIERTLMSVLNQTYRHLEVWVVDDGSGDRTPDIVRQFAERDPRVRLLQQANEGVAAARNLGIQNAQGEFIAPIDADDLWHPENLAKQVECAIAGGTNLGVVYSWSVYIDEADVLLGGVRAFAIAGDVFLTLLCHNFIGNASASLIRRCCLETVGGYDSEFRAQSAQGCEDWDLYLRLSEQYAFDVVPEFLVGYRKLRTSMSQDYTAMAKSYCLALQGAKQRQPQLPDRLFHLSKGNFFMYLAYEADRAGDAHNTWVWIGRALRSDPITPLLRPSLYQLVLKNSGLGWRSRSQQAPKMAVPSKGNTFGGLVGFKGRLTAWIMVTIGNVFHVLVPVLAGFPKR